MSTVRDLIYGSMRLIGAVASGETPAANEVSDALSVLNDMLDSWSTEGLIIPATTAEKFDLVVGQQIYTMGSAGNFNTTKPIKIHRVSIEQQGSNAIELPIEMINVDQWSNIGVKNTQSSIPLKVYIEGTNPLETLNLWPIPSVTNKIIIYSEKALGSFASANTTIVLPPGYNKALRYNLAIELAPEFGKSATPEILGNATASKENIKRLNMKPVLMECDPALGRGGAGFNWLIGE